MPSGVITYSSRECSSTWEGVPEPDGRPKRSRERTGTKEALLPVRARLPDPAPSLVDGSLDVPGRRRGDSRERQHLSPNAPPPLAFLHTHGSRSWTIGRAADTAAGCTPGRRGAWSSFDGSSRGANRPSALFRESVEPGERALKAKFLTLSQRWFERLRRALVPLHADSGETAPVASLIRRRHQQLGQQFAPSALAKLMLTDL